MSEKQIGLSGIILAGGQNRRMGGFHKALLPFHEETLVLRQIRRLQEICSDIILVTNEPGLFSQLAGSSVTIISDVYPGKGPLSGMHAALSCSRHENAWLVACDMPFICSQAAKLLLERKEAKRCDAVVPFINGRIHPLHGIYDKRCGTLIPAMIGEGRYRVIDFLETMKCERVPAEDFESDGIDTRFVLNVNTPEQYQRSLEEGASF